MSDWQPVSMTWNEFCDAGLNKAGVLVEVRHKRNKQKEQFLIGDINTIAGVCDDCVAFQRYDKVIKYKTLIEKDWS